MSGYAVLKIKYIEGEEDEFKLDPDRAYYTFGRAYECDYRFHSGKISNVHFTLMTRSGGKKHELVDGFPGRRQGTEVVGKKPSTNGVFINSDRVKTRQDLHHGDKISLPDGTELEYIFFRPSSQSKTEDDTEASYPQRLVLENPFTDVNLKN